MTFLKDPDFWTWSNATNTYATIRVWDEAAWDYHTVSDGPVVNRNAETDYRAMHSLLYIVLRIRYV